MPGFPLQPRGNSDLTVGSILIDPQATGGATPRAKIAVFTIEVGDKRTADPDLNLRFRFSPALESPPIITCQPRVVARNEEMAERFADQFAVRTMNVTNEAFSLKIKRVDGGGNGWTVDLFIDVIAMIPQNE